MGKASYKITAEEKELLNSIEKNEWRTVSKLGAEKKRLQEIAENTVREQLTEQLKKSRA